MKIGVSCGLVALVALWCSFVIAEDGKVYKSWPEAQELVQNAWRPIVAVFVQQGDSQFMGSSSSVMGDKIFKKALSKIVLIQVDLVKKGNEESLKVADDKNNELMSKLLGQAKTLPIFVVAGPDMKALKIWEKADPAVVKREAVQVLKNAIKQCKPLEDDDIRKAKKLLREAEKQEESGKNEAAIKSLKEVVRINKLCGFAKKAQEMIDRLEAEEEGGDTEGFDDEDEEDEEDEAKEEDKEEAESKPDRMIALLKTDFGDIEIELMLNKAPMTCEHFINMAKNGIYDGSTFGYIERNSLIQCVPDPKKELPEEIEADFSDDKHEVGAVAMAHGSSTRKIGAEFYILIKKMPDRDGEYSVFARVRNGMAVAKAIASSKTMNNKPVNKISINRIEIKE